MVIVFVLIKNIGIVILVKCYSGRYNFILNCFIIYGEVNDLKVKDNVIEKVEK